MVSDKNFRFLTTADWSSRSGTAVLPLALTYSLVLIISARHRTSATHFYFVCARRNHNKVFVPTMEDFASADAMAMLHFAKADRGGLDTPLNVLYSLAVESPFLGFDLYFFNRCVLS